MSSASLSIPLSLYIHIPWCVKKCPYCDFNSHETVGEIPENAYIKALQRDLLQDLPLVQNRPIKSIFFGGGTPSLFSPQGIGKILNHVSTHLTLEENLEITLEANPGTIEHKSFSDYQQAGINRISLGAQSFQNEKLEKLGRIHKAEETKKAIEKILSANFRSFNIDLMYGLPNQTLEDALFDLGEALSFSPPHLSWYNLTIEPNTIFANRPPVLPNDDIIADIEAAGKALLATRRLHQYEISAFSIPGQSCQHNLNYWEFGDYLGIGAGAHAKITDLKNNSITRYTKTRYPKSYLTEYHPLLASSKIIPTSELSIEFMLNALRLTHGTSVFLFEERTGLPISTIHAALQQAVEKNLLVVKDQKIIPTPLGRQFLNDLLQQFF